LTSLWRRLIAKALKPRRPGRRLASKSYGVRLRPVASGKRRFGVRSFADRAWRAPYGDARGGESWESGRKDGEKSGRACGEERGRNHRAEERSREDGPTCSPARTRSPAPPREAAVGEPPPPPLFPIRARSSRRRAVVSPSPPLVLHRPRHGATALPPFFLQQDPSRLLPLFPIRAEQPPEGCCVPAASSGPCIEQDTSRRPASSLRRAGPSRPPPVFALQVMLCIFLLASAL
jgi:hypothetical protein